MAMQKEHWQAATFIVAALAVGMAAAAYYNRAEARRLGALLAQAEAAPRKPAEREIVYVRQPAAPAPYRAPDPNTLPAGSRCIAHTLVMKGSDGAWRNVGRC